MKPSRGKRESPSGLGYAFSWARSRAAGSCADARAPPLSQHACRPSALASRAGHDRFEVGQKTRAKVAHASARVLQRACVRGPATDRGYESVRASPRGGWPQPSTGRSRRASGTVRGARARPAVGRRLAAARPGSVVASATLPTRLETRTKESNVSASRRAVRDSQAK